VSFTSGIPLDAGRNSRFASAYLIKPPGEYAIFNAMASQAVFFGGCTIAFKAD
jgi:hypothetical protein